MEQWYALSAVSGKEQEAIELLERRISRENWCEWRILKKVKIFRSGGILHLVEDVMFPGYILVRTDCPEKLVKELQRAKDFPQPLIRSGNERIAKETQMIPLEAADLMFLKAVCGDNLKRPMGITQIKLSDDRRIEKADGILSGYLNQVVKLNLHKRFAIVEVELFNRKQEILFGLKLEHDLAV